MARPSNKTWKSINKHKRSVDKALNGAKTIAIYDTETTGLLKDNPKIIQFSAILYKIENENITRELDRINEYINPEMLISEEISELTGITNEELEQAPTEKEIGSKCLDFLMKADVLGGYNQESFDKYVIANMAKRIGYPLLDKPQIDVLKMARNIVPYEIVENIRKGKWRLQTIHPIVFPFINKQFHNSLADVEATAELLNKFLVDYKQLTPDLEGGIKREINNIWYWENSYKFDMKRIYIDFGDKTNYIFWDITKQRWSCKSEKAAVEFFKETDMEYVEDQVLERFLFKCSNDDIETKVLPTTMDSFGWSVLKGQDEYKKGQRIYSGNYKELKQQNENYLQNLKNKESSWADDIELE